MRLALLFLLIAALLVTCGGTTVVEGAGGTTVVGGTDCQAACEQASQCLGRVEDCYAGCSVRASLDMAAGCSDADSAELAGFSVAVLGVSPVPSACSALCPSCPAQEAAWMACAKVYCDPKPWTQVCQFSGI